MGRICAHNSGRITKGHESNNISCLSQAAAVAAITDQAYMRETCERTAEMAAAATHELSSLGFKVYESFTNFLIDLKTADHAISAETMLLSEGVVLRSKRAQDCPIVYA